MSSRYFFFVFGAALLGACVSADAATRLTAADDFGSRSNLLAVDATDFDVFSFVLWLDHGMAL